MPNWGAIYNLAQQIASESDEEESQSIKDIREAFIKDCYDRGGIPFIERAKKYGRTEGDGEIIWRPWFEDAARLVADFRVSHVLTTGAAQVAKTLINTLVIVYAVCSGRLNGGWFYDTLTSLQNNSRLQFHPIARAWIAGMAQDGIYISPKGNLSRFMVDGAYLAFGYVSTSVPSDGTGSAVGSAAASFQADLLALEERSQYPQGAADPLPRRLGASKLPSRPIRELGTQGAGGGIESIIKSSDKHFYPHVVCPTCNHLQALDPKGCLLRPTTIRDALGRQTVSYFSASSRPVKWFYHDEADKVGTAYIGCQHCETELPMETRINARMRCKKTGVWLSDFLDEMPVGVQAKDWRCTVDLSPLVRETPNLAPTIIKRGLEDFSPIDWIQQELGHTSEAEKASITEKLIREAISAPKLSTRPNYIIAGIDMGRNEDWLTIVAYWLPFGHERMIPATISDRTVRQILFCGAIQRSEIVDLLEEYQVDYGIIDNEPSRETAMDLCQITCLDLGNQIYRTINNNVRSDVVVDGGRSAECWTLNTNYFADAILNSFLLPASDGYPLIRLSQEWDKHLTDKSALSPAKHLMAPWRSHAGHWQRASDNIDDLFMATHFAETAFYILINGLKDPKRANPDKAYNAFNYSLHTLTVKEAQTQAYGHRRTDPLLISINWYKLTAIFAQTREDGLFMLDELKGKDHEGLTRDIKQWVSSRKHSGKVHIFGLPTGENILGWDDFWIVARRISLIASANYTDTDIPIVESVSEINRFFTMDRIYVHQSMVETIRELEIEVAWNSETGKLTGRNEYTECLRALVWQIGRSQADRGIVYGKPFM